jgi:hypothetical protein
MVLALQSPVTIIAEISGPFRLTATPVRVTLPGNPVRAALQASDDATLYVVLRELKARAEPGVSFAVYLDLPENASPETRQDRRIGSLNFFGSAAHAQADDGSSDWRSYDLTAVARRLLERGRLRRQMSITIEPNGAPLADSDATIGSIAIVQR